VIGQGKFPVSLSSSSQESFFLKSLLGIYLTPLPLGPSEISLSLYGIYVALLGAYVLVTDGHVNVDILYARLSPRTKAGVSLFSWLVFFLWCGALVWTGWIRGWESLLIGERESTAFGCPIYPVKLSLAVGGSFLFLQGLAGYIRNIYTFITGKKID
jgi:TRAP-type mannitol/chloroaromatic compound transport system permease small subunit